MKNLLIFALVSAFALPAFARTTYVTGNGQDSGVCSDGPIGTACINAVKGRAEQDGIRDADWRCQSQQGTSRRYTAQCHSSCYPNYIPPRNGPTTVRCNSTCTMQCEI
jgi:hypothetical protein